ncbi:MAG: nucleotidyltransferase domain-containing protein [archaeon]
MLEIFNNLEPFFEENYRDLGVREYARLVKISPPTASKILGHFKKEGLLLCQEERRYLLYRANRENKVLIELSKAFWLVKLKDLAEYLKEEFNYTKIILFGSLVKLEATKNSDIDLYLNTLEKEVNLKKFEKILNRKIQLHFKASFKNPSLKKNIGQGVGL